MTLFPAILDLLKEKGGGDILLFGCGIIPDEDMKALEKMGVSKLFTPGAVTTEIIDWLKEAVASGKKDEKIL